jgi:hypothetical protein
MVAAARWTKRPAPSVGSSAEISGTMMSERYVSSTRTRQPCGSVWAQYEAVSLLLGQVALELAICAQRETVTSPFTHRSCMPSPLRSVPLEHEVLPVKFGALVLSSPNACVAAERAAVHRSMSFVVRFEPPSVVYT